MIATYRLQLHPAIGFSDVEALIPYFKRLGVSHLYLSPITEARPGSMHGYDVIDHNALRDDLGGREGFDQLRQAALEAGLKLILDFVPNHAGVGPENEYWQDLLAYGQHSVYADYFDVDWQPLKPELQGKILLPFLGKPYGDILDDGEIELRYEEGRLFATYYEHRFALSPLTYDTILEKALPHYERTDEYWDLKDLCEAYATLEPGDREKAETLRSRLAKVAERIDLEDVLNTLDGLPLHQLLEQQNWRLSYWQTAGHEINYRRFFTINSLVALRMEKPEVFWDAHRLLGEVLALEGVDGVRIDHIDGLFDPQQYLEQLEDLGADHIWVEKILAHGETLPDAWPVEGTTGYEFMNDTMNVLLQPESEPVLDRVYRRFVPSASSFEEIAYQSKKLIIDTMLTSELSRLSYELDRLSEEDYHTRDFTLGALRDALAEVVAAFSRYRTYLPEHGENTESVIREASYKARQRNPAAEPTVYDFITQAVLGEVQDEVVPLQRAWTGRFQQYTAPVAAKGVEDTAFYRYLRLIALCEVGGEPDQFGLSTEAFHSHARFRAHRYPRNLLTTSTHDHKRGADTRMRLITLTEIPERWEQVVHDLHEMGSAHRGEHGPARDDEYLFYQILAALWHEADKQELAKRLAEYMEKASRESKTHTNWANPNAGYEEDLKAFVQAMIEDERTQEVLGPLAADLAHHGFFNSLSQHILQFTTPGVPDIYQGAELPDLSLVDPDNRRPVDYDLRKSLLDEHANLIEDPSLNAVRNLIEKRDPAAKLYATARLLHLRRDHPALFEKGAYQPLSVNGENDGLAFARHHEDDTVVVFVPRFPLSWEEKSDASISLTDELFGHTWHEVLTGAQLDAEEELDTNSFPLPWAVMLQAD